MNSFVLVRDVAVLTKCAVRSLRELHKSSEVVRHLERPTLFDLLEIHEDVKLVEGELDVVMSMA